MGEERRLVCNVWTLSEKYDAKSCGREDRGEDDGRDLTGLR